MQVLPDARHAGLYIVLRVLLHNGANPNVQSAMTAKERPLHIAVGSNDISLALELLVLFKTVVEKFSQDGSLDNGHTTG